jgi:uncharacterized protein (TIGR02145 family)
MQFKDRKYFLGGLNSDDSPIILPEHDYTDAIHIRTGSSDEQKKVGPAETLQGEIPVDIVGSVYYYGEAIGGQFIYEGHTEVRIGTQVWMKKNYDVNYPGSKVYNDLEVNREIYGGLYTWNQIKGSNFCPTGWHVPSMGEWNILFTELGGDAVAGGKMKEPGMFRWATPNTGASDSSGFKALPGGSFELVFGKVFGLVGLNAKFWSLDTIAITLNDWFLPSKDELNAIYTELYLQGLGGFSAAPYWSSTEFVNIPIHLISAWSQDFSTGVVSNGTVKSNLLRVRACRSFTSTDIYSLRDNTPDGGWIFNIVNNGGGSYTYLVAAPSDQSISHEWSNIVAVAIGVTAQGAIIGTGQTNTTAIINQGGHVDSAAKLCDDLIVTAYIPWVVSLAYNSAIITREAIISANYLSVRFIKDSNILSPLYPSTTYSVLLNGDCIDQENRKLYPFYIDTYYNQAWIFEIDIDTRKQTVVFFDSLNRIGFNADFKIYNARVVQGRLIWTDNNMPEYQMDVNRAKKSFYYGIGYGLYPTVTEWDSTANYLAGMIVWRGRYFYKCLQYSSGIDPLGNTAYWENLCLVEEAYYSTDPHNFYFAAIPPYFCPIATYMSDSQRKTNNLRQTIWQFAYRYVYMDYRKSTFSPACVPDMPDSEEEVASGLANELHELNNVLKVRINTGGEEVRKIEVVARSNQDPSTWYLIEVIDKFIELEGTSFQSLSPISEPLRGDITISIPIPVVINSGITLHTEMDVALSIPTPSVYNYNLSFSVVGMAWDGIDEGAGRARHTTVTCKINLIGTHAFITDIPTWITVMHGIDAMALGDMVNDTWILDVYPTDANYGSERWGDLELTDTKGNTARVSLTQHATPI